MESHLFSKKWNQAASDAFRETLKAIELLLYFRTHFCKTNLVFAAETDTKKQKGIDFWKNGTIREIYT